MSAGRGAPGLLAFLKMNAGRIQIAVFQQPSGFPPDISGAQVSVDEQRRSRYGFGAFKPLSGRMDRLGMHPVPLTASP